MFPTHEAIVGAVSPETAFVQDGYPYGRLRCKRRVWVETTKHGQRFCAQTTDPKRATEFWNKPKCSTYHEVVVLYLEPQDDGREFVTYGCLSLGATDAEINALRLKVGDDALRASGRWETIEMNRKMRDIIGNRYLDSKDRIVVTMPLPSWAEMVLSQEVQAA